LPGGSRGLGDVYKRQQNMPMPLRLFRIISTPETFIRPI
jgi:hypothetical protein